MRVLHVITGLAPGGAEHQLRLLLRRLPHDCEVVTLSNPGAVAAAIRADGTTVHELTMSSNRDVSAVVKLRRLIRDGRFDLVHTHLYRACVHGRVAARLAGVPAVATEHSLGDGVIEGRRTSTAVRALYLATERAGRVTIAVSGTVAARLRAWGVPARRISVIPNGIDAAEFRYDPLRRAAARARYGIAPDAVVVGGVGRLEPGKRFDHLIWALTQVPGATLLLVGDGSARRSLRDQAHRQGVGGRVVFAGSVGHVRDLLCAMDVFVSPSGHETFGLAVLEALACGLPALYAVCPPLEESGDESARRLSRDPESLPRALRAELAGLAERGGARRPVPAIVGRYDIARLAESVGCLYDRIVPAPERAESKGTPR
ncbi:glycosyltransferase [Actinoplanes sp. NPDC051475]|uniref:glycosyltransferase n=1 Tax=Actinoplanes sp. NPDC051475 TaxID=3157225 RepID=UPI003450808C